MQSLGNDFVLCVKKLNKKDPISKTKGLQQLTELVKKSSKEETSEFLQHWCRLYPTLSADVDHKVREATQVCHGAIAAVCGRTLRQHLGQLCAVWMCAQYDSHAPAAAAAHSALASTFPGSKLKEFITFSRKEVLNYVMHNIVDNDEDTIRRQDEAADSSRERYALLCHCSLRAVGIMCDIGGVTWPQISTLPKSDKYWRLTHPAVRNAWFEATAAIIKGFPKEFEAECGSRCIKYMLHEVNGNYELPVWECLLMLLQHTKENNVWSDKSKELTNRIIEFAENGGAGTSPLLLPVMTSLPDCVVSEHLYVTFYNAVLNGLDKKCIHTSKAERRLRLASVSECLQHICDAHLQQYGQEFIARLFTNWLDKIMNMFHHIVADTHVITTSARHLATLIIHWSALNHQSLVMLIWQNMRTTISHVIHHCADDKCALLLTTMNDDSTSSKKAKHITFDDEEISKHNDEQEHSLKADPFIISQYKHDLTMTAHHAVIQYFELMKRKRQVTLVSARMMGLLEAFHTHALFTKVAEHMKCTSLYGLYELVHEWLREDATPSSVQLLLSLLEPMDDDERSAAFGTFSQLPPDAAELCVCACVNARAQWARRWLKEEAVGDILVNSLDRPECPHTDALQMCFELDENGASLVSEKTLQRVASRLGAILRRAPDERPIAILRRAIAASNSLLSTLAAYEHMHDTCSTLVNDMFALTLQCDETSLSAAVLQEALSCWRDALAPLEQTRKRRLIHTLAQTAHDVLCLECTSSQIEHIAAVCSHLTDKCELDSVIDTTILLTTHNSDIDITQHAICYYCLVSKLNCPHLQISSKQPTMQDLALCSNRDMFDAHLLESVLLGQMEGTQEGWLELLLQDSRLAGLYITVLRNSCLWDALSDAYLHSPPMHSLAALTRDNLIACIRRTIRVMSDVTRKCLAMTAASCASRGHYWAYAAATWAKEAEETPPTADDRNTNDDPFYHMLQANEDDRRWELIALHNLEMAFPEETDAVQCEDGALDYVAELYYKHRHVLALDKDISELPWIHLAAVTGIAEYFRAEVRARGWTLKEVHWDMINISLCGFINALRCSRRHHYAQVAMLCRSTLGLYSAVEEFISGIPTRSAREQPQRHVADLPKEWTEVFLPNIHENILDIILDALDDAVPEGDMTAARHVYVTALEDATSKLAIAPRHSVMDVMRHCAAALSAEWHYKYKYLAYKVLLLVSQSLLQKDAEALSILNEGAFVDDDTDPVTTEAMDGCFVTALMPYYERLYDELRELDREDAQGSRCGAVLGMMLLAHAMMETTNAARGNLALLYIRTYSQNKMVSSLMTWSKRLLPKHLNPNWFTEESRHSLLEPVGEHVLSRLACRGVWLAAHTKAAAADAGIEELVRKYVTPLAVKAHLREAAALDGDELSVQVMWSTRELNCTRRLDDASAKLTIQLSPCHPLHPPRHTVCSGPSLHPHQHYLAHQRGSVRGMVQWWSQAVQRWVLRAPVCCVCYSRLHSESGRLPSVLCKVCKYKFHIQCLQKWFNTSNNIKCPHCRSPFKNHNMYNHSNNPTNREQN